MADDREKIKREALGAAGAEELAGLLRDAGAEDPEKEAERLFGKARAQKADRELSPDELEAVAGGYDRNWLTDGCAATVEINSWCWTDDSCIRLDVTYDSMPSYHCERCGGIVVRNRPDDFHWRYTCTGCGYSELVPVDTETAE